MGLIRKLIIGEWLKSFVGSLMVLILLMAIGNIVSELMRAVADFPTILLNFLLDLPKWLGTILPVSTLIATLFSLNKLQLRNELVAIFSLGFSRRKFVMTIGGLGFLVMIFTFLNNSYLVPFGLRMRVVWLKDNLQQFRDHSKKGIMASTMETGKVWYKGTNHFFSFVAYDKSNNSVKDISIYYFGAKNNFLEKIIYAKEAKGTPGSSKWVLLDGRELGALDNQEVFPKEEKFSLKEFSLSETPEDLRQLESDINFLNITHLYSYIQKLNSLEINTREYQVFLYDKLATSFSCFFFSLFSLGAIFHPNRRGSTFGKKMVFVLAFVITYWFVYSSCLAMGSNGKWPAAFAVFLIPTLCVFYLTGIFIRNRRLV